MNMEDIVAKVVLNCLNISLHALLSYVLVIYLTIHNQEKNSFGNTISLYSIVKAQKHFLYFFK